MKVQKNVNNMEKDFVQNEEKMFYVFADFFCIFCCSNKAFLDLKGLIEVLPSTVQYAINELVWIWNHITNLLITSLFSKNTILVPQL